MKNNPTYRYLFWITFFLLFILGIPSSFAQEGEKVRLSLISESNSVGTDTILSLGLRAQLAPHWKTYWRSPGIAGYAAKLTWEGSRNVKSARILWPLPRHVSTQMGSVNAYGGDVIFPLLVEVADPLQPVHAVVQVDMLVCDESNCLPVTRLLTLDLPVGPKVESAEAPLLQRALTKIPTQELSGHPSSRTFQIESVEILGENDRSPALQVSLSKPTGIFSKDDLPDLFLEMKDLVIDNPRASLSKDQKSILYSAPIYPDTNRMPTHLPNLVGKPVKLTVGYQGQGIEIERTLRSQSLSLALWGTMLLVAFIGGLILNVMPCVLPVLSLKILSVLRQGGGNTKIVRQEFLATVLGILVSFIFLACSAIILKISGHAIGWGTQFQEPYFLVGLICILILFSCNLMGFFEFRLPSVLASIGGISPHRETLFGSFLEGALVTALATPCTAPFLGTALAFAFSQGPFEILSIFTIMGFGLAFPFLLIAFFPKFATKLPKPGAWMVKVKYVFAFLLILTVFWLLYVLSAEIGNTGAYGVAMLMVTLSLSLSKFRNNSENQKRVVWLGAFLMIALCFTIPAFISEVKESHPSQKTGLWRPFEPDRIESYVKAGKTVFVNVTADWCLTCQANKYFVLKNQAVLEALHEENIITMEADWTNHDPKITAYLKTFHQYGIPFYAVYGCRTPKGEFLGQILTSRKVIDALKREKCSINILEK